MGITDFLKRGIKELMIARPDEAKDLAIYKHPDQTIPTYIDLPSLLLSTWPFLE